MLFLGNLLNRCYERLEFLGDAVLDLVITNWLYDIEPCLPPGDLTNWRAFAVCNDTLGAICVRSGLSVFLQHRNESLGEDVARYSERQCGQVRMNNNASPSISSSLSTNAPPKILADILEALIGAIFVHSRGDLVAVRDVIDRLIIQPYLSPNLLSSVISSEVSSITPRWGPELTCTSILNSMQTTLDCPRCLQLRYDINTLECIIQSHGTILTTGAGKNKKESKKQACLQLFGTTSADRQTCYLRLKSICEEAIDDDEEECLIEEAIDDDEQKDECLLYLGS